MPGRPPGPICISELGPTWVDAGTSERTRSEPPVAVGLSNYSTSREFDSAIQALEKEVANAGAHLTIDSSARSLYERLVAQMADDLRQQARSGRITWKQAANEANELRNTIMEVVRARSTPVGRAVAQQLKSEGVTLNMMVARKTVALYGKDAEFALLGPARQNIVYAEIVKSAGKSNPRITMRMRTFSRFGRSLLILSVAISVYNIATAQDKVSATGREVTVTGAGIGGGIAGGALAGLACGPGAPVCVTIGAFVGGALAAWGVDSLW